MDRISGHRRVNRWRMRRPRAPAPVAVVQPQDAFTDCAVIQAEVAANNAKVQELAGSTRHGPHPQLGRPPISSTPSLAWRSGKALRFHARRRAPCAQPQTNTGAATAFVSQPAPRAIRFAFGGSSNPQHAGSFGFAHEHGTNSSFRAASWRRRPTASFPLLGAVRGRG
jgi:hypothetical protein